MVIVSILLSNNFVPGPEDAKMNEIYKDLSTQRDWHVWNENDIGKEMVKGERIKIIATPRTYSDLYTYSLCLEQQCPKWI